MLCMLMSSGLVFAFSERSNAASPGAQPPNLNPEKASQIYCVVGQISDIANFKNLIETRQ